MTVCDEVAGEVMGAASGAFPAASAGRIQVALPFSYLSGAGNQAERSRFRAVIQLSRRLPMGMLHAQYPPRQLRTSGAEQSPSGYSSPVLTDLIGDFPAGPIHQRLPLCPTPRTFPRPAIAVASGRGTRH
jgi:hypothetical protein